MSLVPGKSEYLQRGPGGGDGDAGLGQWPVEVREVLVSVLLMRNTVCPSGWRSVGLAQEVVDGNLSEVIED